MSEERVVIPEYLIQNRDDVLQEAQAAANDPATQQAAELAQQENNRLVEEASSRLVGD